MHLSNAIMHYRTYHARPLQPGVDTILQDPVGSSRTPRRGLAFSELAKLSLTQAARCREACPCPPPRLQKMSGEAVSCVSRPRTKRTTILALIGTSGNGLPASNANEINPPWPSVSGHRCLFRNPAKSYPPHPIIPIPSPPSAKQTCTCSQHANAVDVHVGTFLCRSDHVHDSHSLVRER